MSSSTSGASSVLNTTTAGQAAQQTAGGLASLTNNFQQFLSLLTTQLQNQDPTNPMDTNQFTQQLVEMTGVQQQLLSNNLLTTLVAQGQGGLSNSVNYIGKTVEVSNTDQTLSGGQATWNYTLPSQAANAQITITDNLGDTVWSGAAPSSGLNAGMNSITWDGKDASGAQLPDGGTYTISITATDKAGNTLTAQPVTVGTVTAATVNNGVAFVTIGNASFPVSSVVSVTNPSSNNSGGNSSSGSGS